MAKKAAKALPLRAEIAVEKTWDLSLVYATVDLWRADLERVSALIPEMAAFKGKLSESGATLLAALEKSEEIGKIFGKLGIYVHLHLAADSNDVAFKKLGGELSNVGVKYSQAMSWFTPELSDAVTAERVEQFIAEVPALALYRKDFEDIIDGRKHVLSAEVEDALAIMGKAIGGGSGVFSAFNSTVTFPDVVDSKGKKHSVTHATYGELLESKDRVLRKNAFKAVLGTFQHWINPISNMYLSAVRTNTCSAKLRGYAGARAMSLYGNGIPVAIYDNLVDTVNANLPRLHDYLALRKRSLGVKELNFWDLYVPITGDVKFELSYEQANEEILKAVAVLGDDYVQILRDGIAARWVDVHENKGKRSGAFSSGNYGTPPYVLLNWTNSLRSAFTSAHEYGHSMHSYFTRTTQPYTYANYTIFVAEVASTVNEGLFAHHLLKTNSDPAVRKFILGRQIEDFRATLFRQTMFAEFEKVVHEMEEKGVPLTSDVLSETYLGLNAKYFGKGVKLDKLVGAEWARIPHFYGAFYVYQYATGIAAATALVEQILTEGEPAVKRYRQFLASGSSENSVELLKKAGVDLNDPAVVQKAIDAWSKKIAEFKAIK
ncbi:MAG: oligoendopeptidase F [Candidatus Obscuribacterales bacterium]|nr:oligoendopeptidase F [Candidatus Obscuribacterales bacterium]